MRTELVNAGGGEAINYIHNASNKIWKNASWPEEWKRSLYTIIQKKMIQDFVKIQLPLFLKRAKFHLRPFRRDWNPIWKELANKQARFRKRSGCRHHPYMWFIDYSKAFDCVDHNIMWSVLRENAHT